MSDTPTLTPSEPKEFFVIVEKGSNRALIRGEGEIWPGDIWPSYESHHDHYHVVEHSTLVDANAELEKWKQAAKDQDEYCDRVEEESEKLKAELEQAKAEVKRLHDKYDFQHLVQDNERLTQELERAKAELIKQAKNYGVFNKDIHDKLKFLREELERAKEGNEKAYNRGVTKGVDALQPEIEKLKAECVRLNKIVSYEEIDKLKLMAESYRVKLAKCVDAMFISISRSDDYGDSHCSQPIRQVIHEARAALDQGEK